MAQLIYVIEDDESIRTLLDAALTSEGYEVWGFSDASPALKAMAERRPALVIFDIMLEGMDGITALKLMRQSPELRRIKAMMLTARDTETDKVTGLDAGADDYMTKPFSVLELCARVRALLRRANIETEKKLTVGNLTLDGDGMTAEVDGEEVPVTPREFNILFKLLSYPKKIFSRAQLMDEFWEADTDASLRSVDVYVTKLRDKFSGCDGFEIKTVRGVGYKAVLK